MDKSPPKTSSTTSKLRTIVSDILYTLKELGNLMPLPFETPYAHVRRIRKIPYKNYYSGVRRLEKQGMIKIIRKGQNRYLKLTPRGNLAVLLNKAKIQNSGGKKWDGKWRMVIFDIPETQRNQRDQLRCLLRNNNFYKLQYSVFIHPFSFNSEAIAYLKETGLITFIRILRIDKIDDDTLLKEHFKLK